jgi:hypothetical protein
MKFINKFLNTEIKRKVEFSKTYEYAIKECEAAKNPELYLEVVTKYLSIKFDYSPGEDAYEEILEAETVVTTPFEDLVNYGFTKKEAKAMLKKDKINDKTRNAEDDKATNKAAK